MSGLPSGQEAFERLMALVKASSAVWRTKEQQEEIDRARELCDMAIAHEILKGKK